MRLDKLIEILQKFPGDYEVTGEIGACIILESNGVDYLKGVMDQYLDLETGKITMPAREALDETKKRIKK